MNDTQLPGGDISERNCSGQADLCFTIHDPDVVAELRKYAGSGERARFVQAAPRLGVVSLRQASGLLDADEVRHEGERLIASTREVLSEHMWNSAREIEESLRKCFDPTSGGLPKRLARLVSKNGDLEQLLERHLGDETSTLSGTLQKHVGEDSALLKMLSPDQSNGVLAVMDELLQDALRRQSTTTLEQFSLDDKESVLLRLVVEVTGRNGNLRQDLTGDIETIRRDFSLDNEGCAMSRLRSPVDAAVLLARAVVVSD